MGRKNKFSFVFWLSLIFLAACGSPDEPQQVFPTPTFALDLSDNRPEAIEIITADELIVATVEPFDFTTIGEDEDERQRATIAAINRISIKIDATRPTGAISPLIYGIAVTDEDVVAAVRPTLYSWTGNGTTRYNINSGRGWNEGRETLYKNENPFPTSENYAEDFLQTAEAVGAQSSFTLPTIGWGAKDTSSCSFPDVEQGTCTRGLESTCLSGRTRANPTQTSEAITTADILRFIRNNPQIDFVSVLFEPELWGITHYDLHPDCVTYAEVLELYTTYAAAIRDESPSITLMGPGTCCWTFYFDSAAGEDDKLQNGDVDFIPWFLQNMQAFDTAAGKRHLDVLDIHYFPAGLDNEFDDQGIAGHRLRAPRSLYDPLYPDESNIREPVQLIPRMTAWIDEFYPGTKLAISAWNFGATNTVNGALAIAEVLGIYGREGLYYASYFPGLEKDTPAFYAFKMYTNVDDAGERFGDLALHAESSHPEELSVYSALDSESGDLHIILINRVKEVIEFQADIVWEGFESNGEGAIYTYSGPNPLAVNQEDPGILGGATDMGINRQRINLEGYSITHMILEPAANQNQSTE